MFIRLMCDFSNVTMDGQNNQAMHDNAYLLSAFPLTSVLILTVLLTRGVRVNISFGQ